MIRYLEKVKKYYVNFRGWSTKRKLVVIESDDWGSIRSNSKDTLRKLESVGINLDQNLFCKYDTLESKLDIQRLFSVLKEFRDKNGNHPVITANTIVANPDFVRIREHEFSEYYYEDIRRTYLRKYPDQDVLAYWKSEGIQKHRLLWPQFHGREHFNFKWWMDVLRKNEPVELMAFDDFSLLGVRNTTLPQGVNGYMAAYDSDVAADIDVFKKVIQDGTDLFESIFGFRSTSFVAPCSIRSDELDSTLAKNGLKFHQMGQQTTPLLEGYKLVNRFWGDTNQHGQLYWRRNSTFEPYKSFPKPYHHQVLEDAKIAFACGKPLVINSHRINYVSGIEPLLVDYSLDYLTKLIKELVSTYPDLEFVSSDELGCLMEDNINKT